MFENLKAIKEHGLDYFLGARKALKERGELEGNKDGKYSVEEFAASFGSSIFAKNAGNAEKVDSLLASNMDLFKEYAGNDGILNTGEYVNLINSEKYNGFIEEYRAYNGFDAET